MGFLSEFFYRVGHAHIQLARSPSKRAEGSSSVLLISLISKTTYHKV